MDSRTALLAQPDDLLRKYRELLDKHERLLRRFAETAAERIVVSKLSRATLRSRSSATALIEGGSVVAANPAWRAFDPPSLSREWKDGSYPSRMFASLADAAFESNTGLPARASAVYVRVCDGFRVRLRAELIEPDSILATAIEDADSGPRLHRVRNHLAAATLQARLLVEESDAGLNASRRAAAISELIHLATDALQSDPQVAR